MSLAARTSSIALVALALVGCSGGTSDNPPPSNENASSPCLADLASYCCGDSGPQRSCIGDFASASQCSSWPAGSTVLVYPTACSGYTAVRVMTSYSTFYVFDAATSALVAIGDNAFTNQNPADTSIECGAGPASFTVPIACGDGWLNSTSASACSKATATPSAYCGTH
jgi:hypothetical protein